MHPMEGKLYKLEKEPLIDFLNKNDDYLIELTSLVKRTSCPPILLEYIVWSHIAEPFNKQLMIDQVRKIFVELDYDPINNCLSGSIDGESVSLIIDSLFFKMIQRFVFIMEKNHFLLLQYRNKKDDDGKVHDATIGEFLENMDVMFNLPIEKRCKGLAEVDTDLLFLTMLNPKVRTIKKMTIRDFNKTMDTFDLLHGKSADQRSGRRDLLDNAYISYKDIDN
jgi:DNA gyrase/topoisomerase IV subunit B